MHPYLATAKRRARQAESLVRRQWKPLASAGFVDNRVTAPLLEGLSDEELSRLNRLLPWSCFTVDGRGRRFGDAAWTGKRQDPQPIPDRRILLMDDRFGLDGRHVLEIGCFEGVHTTALAKRAARVTAIDSRVENVVKTIVRCAFHGWHPEVFTCDVEVPRAMESLASLDVELVHHVGVLYHLRNPVEHILALGSVAQHGLMLDTHVADLSRAVHTMEFEGDKIPYMRFEESGVGDAFSGMYSHAKWLPLPVVVDLLHRAGFRSVDVLEARAERNGPRVLIMAGR